MAARVPARTAGPSLQFRVRLPRAAGGRDGDTSYGRAEQERKDLRTPVSTRNLPAPCNGLRLGVRLGGSDEQALHSMEEFP